LWDSEWDGFVEPVELGQESAQVVERVELARIELDGADPGGDRFGLPSRLRVNDPEAVPGARQT